MTTEFSTLVSFASGVVGIVALIKLINSPLEKIKEHDKDIKEIKEDMKKRNEVDRAVLNGLTAITNHMIDGNGVEKLKQSRDELSRAVNEIVTK